MMMMLLMMMISLDKETHEASTSITTSGHSSLIYTYRKRSMHS